MSHTVISTTIPLDEYEELDKNIKALRKKTTISNVTRCMLRYGMKYGLDKLEAEGLLEKKPISRSTDNAKC